MNKKKLYITCVLPAIALLIGLFSIINFTLPNKKPSPSENACSAYLSIESPTGFKDEYHIIFYLTESKNGNIVFSTDDQGTNRTLTLTFKNKENMYNKIKDNNIIRVEQKEFTESFCKKNQGNSAIRDMFCNKNDNLYIVKKGNSFIFKNSSMPLFICTQQP